MADISQAFFPCSLPVSSWSLLVTKFLVRLKKPWHTIHSSWLDKKTLPVTRVLGLGKVPGPGFHSGGGRSRLKWQAGPLLSLTRWHDRELTSSWLHRRGGHCRVVMCGSLSSLTRWRDGESTSSRL